MRLRGPRSRALGILLCLTVTGCRAEHARAEPASLASALVAPAPAPAVAPVPLDSAPAVAGSPSDPENRSKPELASGDLTERAQHLFEAIAQDEPALGDDFFFPRDPFIPLKDVRDPARYHTELLAVYHRDIREYHASRKGWTGAAFASFELGTPPTWVAPGKEYNKIGYYRTFRGKLRYRIGERSTQIDVSTIISWDGRWYVTHLSPIRH